jgi:DNA-binding IclR family transcriptional regulator
VSLAAEGTVRVLSGPPATERGLAWVFRTGVRVTPQRGAAHVLAVAVPARQEEGVLAAVQALNRARASRRAAQAMLAAPGPLAVGVLGFFVA